MTNRPIPLVVKEAGEAVDAPEGSVPIALYGAGGQEPAAPALEWYRVNNVPTRDNYAGAVYIEALGANGLGPVSGKITVNLPETATRASGASIVVPLAGGALTAAVGGHASRGNNSKPVEIHVTLPNNTVETHFGAIMFNWAKAGQQDTLYFKFPASATFTQYKGIEAEF